MRLNYKVTKFFLICNSLNEKIDNIDPIIKISRSQAPRFYEFAPKDSAFNNDLQTNAIRPHTTYSAQPQASETQNITTMTIIILQKSPEPTAR